MFTAQLSQYLWWLVRNGLLNGFLQESDVIYSQGKDVSATAQMTKWEGTIGNFSNTKK